MTSDVDWAALRQAAVAASRHAYVPYSRFPVGAAALTTSGRIVTGCNVENAAYGVTLCAECGVVSSLLASSPSSPSSPTSPTSPADGPRPVFSPEASRERLAALSCTDGRGAAITPCGRCRQMLAEHAAPGMLVEMAHAEPVTMDDLLPHAFGVDDLDAVSTSADSLRGER